MKLLLVHRNRSTVRYRWKLTKGRTVSVYQGVFENVAGREARHCGRLQKRLRM